MPWELLLRRALAVLLGGRSALPSAVASQIAAESNQLRARLCAASADRLGALFQACQAEPAECFGRLRHRPPVQLARAWAGAVLHAAAARRHTVFDAWRRWACI